MALSAAESLSVCCKTLIHNLTAANAPVNFNSLGNANTLNALQSERNVAGADPRFQQIIQEQWGKHAINDAGSTCKLKLWVEKPSCGAASTIKTLCDNSNTNAASNDNLQYDVSIVQGAGLDGKIEPTDYNCLCAGTQADVLQREIAKKAKDILSAVNIAALNAIAALPGNYSTAVDSLTTPWNLNLFTTAGGNFQLQPQGWMPLLLEFQKMQTQGGVIAVGGDLAAQYNMMPGLSRGINGEYLLPNDIALWYDHNVNTEVADGVTLINPLIAWEPGSIMLLRYMDNFNVSENHITDANVSKGIVNLYGHDFDLSISRDGKCNILRWTLNYVWDLFHLPASAWNSCREQNGKLMFNIGCEPYDCDQLVPA